MLNVIVKHIKTNIAQHTYLFDLSLVERVFITDENKIHAPVFFERGEYTLSGAGSGIASAGCINSTHIFGGDPVFPHADTDCFFGDIFVEYNLEARKINVGDAFKREVALKAIIDTTSGNSIIVYVGNANSLSDQYHYSDSEDMNFKVGYTIGVMFKVNVKQIEELGCADYDKLFINSVIGARKEGTSLVKFNNVIERFYAGDSYVVDIEFSYIDEMFMEDSFLNGLKHFDATLDLDI